MESDANSSRRFKATVCSKTLKPMIHRTRLYRKIALNVCQQPTFNR